MRIKKKVEFFSKQQDTDTVKLCRQRERDFISQMGFFPAYINYSTELKFRHDYKF